MKVKAGVLKPFLHWEAKEAIQLNACLIEKKKKLYLI